MALTDYTPVLQWYADALSDLDDPTGTTKSNPGALSDPTLAGSPDSYAAFTGSEAVSYLPSPLVGAFGTGDLTIVAKLRVDGGGARDIIWQNFDGTASGGTYGLNLWVESQDNNRLALQHAGRSSGFRLESSTNSYTDNQDFIIAFRRSSGTWTIWIDADASGGMSSDTPTTNALGSTGIEAGDITFGSHRGGTSPFTGRIYWFVAFDAAISDTDIQLSDWDTESNLKTAWLGGGGAATGRGRLVGGKLVGGNLVGVH